MRLPDVHDLYEQYVDEQEEIYWRSESFKEGETADGGRKEQSGETDRGLSEGREQIDGTAGVCDVRLSAARSANT